jgi:hypothetical protein
MLEWLDEYQRTGKIKTDYGETNPSEEGEEASDDENDINTEEFETFHHRSPIAENEAPELATDESVRTELQAIIEALSGIVGQSPLDCEQGLEIVDYQIGQLASVRDMLMDIRNRAQRNQDEEVS